MLVLSRHRDEQIVINDNIVVTIVEIRLGIDAPTEVPIHRREVHDAIKRQASGGRQLPAGGQEPVKPPA